MGGSYIIFVLFPNLPVAAYAFLDYLNLCWGVFAFIYLLLSLFSTVFFKRVIPAFFILNIAATLVLIFTPLSFYTNYLIVLESFLLLFMAVSTYAIIKEWVKGNLDAMLIAFASILVLVSVFRDTLYQANIIYSSIGEINSISFVLFTFILSCIIAKNFAKALTKSEQLNTVLEEKLSTEIAFLHAQIKPHFLFNVISAIISISRTDAEKARQLLLDLSGYLRKSFDFTYKKQVASLKNELELVDKYISLQQARFDGRFEITYDVDGHLDKNIPILVIQPLVENAVEHGLMETEENGKIIVTAAAAGDSLLLSVSDNGTGMDEDKINEVLKDDYSKDGVGLKNINNRLIRLYGQGLDIIRNETGGLTVRFTVPLKLGE